MNKQKKIEKMEQEVARLKRRIPIVKKYEFYRLAGEMKVKMELLMKRILILRKTWIPTRNKGFIKHAETNLERIPLDTR